MGLPPVEDPSGDSRTYGATQLTSGDGRYRVGHEVDSVTQSQQQRFINDEKGTASPGVNSSGKEREADTPKVSGERDRARMHGNRKGSGQMRVCKKCGEPLTGQFVRALGGTFHLDCFKCEVSAVQGFLGMLQKQRLIWRLCWCRIAGR
jgi:hypothetical protein